MLLRISKKSCSRRELKEISSKAPKKRSDSSRNSSSDESDSDSSLSIDRYWYTYRRPDGRKEMNTLDHAVTNNININKDKVNEAI